MYQSTRVLKSPLSAECRAMALTCRSPGLPGDGRYESRSEVGGGGNSKPRGQGQLPSSSVRHPLSLHTHPFTSLILSKMSSSLLSRQATSLSRFSAIPRQSEKQQQPPNHTCPIDTMLVLFYRQCHRTQPILDRSPQPCHCVSASESKGSSCTCRFLLFRTLRIYLPHRLSQQQSSLVS